MAKGVSPPLGDGDELLIVDPPQDTSAFVLPERTAIVHTYAGETHLPEGTACVDLQSGGIAHIRLGEHLLDIYAHEGGALVHMPERGLLCSGELGSNRFPPRLASGSDGDAELDALRLCARLVREGRVRLLIPRVGDVLEEPAIMLERLADDVAYLHGLRRKAQRPEGSHGLGEMFNGSDALLPAGRSDSASRAVHAGNVHTMHLAVMNRRN